MPVENPRWRGINHLAFITPDMDVTTRFYHGVLGMRLVSTLMAGPMRHYFFEIAPGNTIAFFEVAGAETFEKQAGVPLDMPLQFDHISFNLPDEQALFDLRERLEAFGCGITEVVDHGIMHSVYFTDPNGIALEASWWALDVTGRPAQYANREVFADPDPVAAVRELMEDGRLASTPRTALVDDVIVDPA